MSIITGSHSFDVSIEVVGHQFHRRWAGTITWTRDLTTQVVDMHIVADKISGTSNSGLYVYWAPDYIIPPEMMPYTQIYPSMPNADSAIYIEAEGGGPDGEGYSYIYGAGPHIDQHAYYVTAAPIVEEPEPEPEPTGSFLGDINARIESLGVQAFEGYAATGAALPYVVTRPLMVDNTTELAINGDAIDWDFNFSVYCCGASVEASFNLALAVIGTLQGAWMRGTTLAASMGYNGAAVEGHYESQVTVQLNQGGIA